MNEEKLYDAISNIDEDLLERSLNRKANSTKKIIFASAAVIIFACLALIVVPMLKRNHVFKKNYSDNMQNTHVYSVKVLAYSDGGEALEAKTEFSFYESSGKKPANKTAEIELFGEKITGRYMQTASKHYNTYSEDYYTFETDGRANTFSLEPDGKIGLLVFDLQVGDERISEEEGLEIGKNFVKKLRSIDGYVLDETYTDEGLKSYRYTFVKKIGGYNTTDSFFVSVAFDGQIMSYSSYMTGKTDDKISLDDIDFEQIEKAAEDKLKSMKKETSSYSYSLFDKTLTVLDDGSPAFILKYEIKIQRDGVAIPELITLVVREE